MKQCLVPKLACFKILIATMAAFTVVVANGAMKPADAVAYRTLSIKEYRDKMAAGWIGQMIGVTLGAPTEFKYIDRMIPESEMPKWYPGLINKAFRQDDLYVEMTFLRTMELYGLDCPIRQAGIDFANSQYGLWCANAAGRNNLRRGIAPPDSSHPKFNLCPNDIDYQIEADYSGLIAPGMPNIAIKLGEKFGRLMNYGDGMYAGQFIGAMYCEAFFETNIVRVIEAGLRAIPAESQYAEMVRDMLRWSKEIPTWEECWHQCQKKYRLDPEYQKASNGKIDCKINGAYVLMGLLYGKGDMDLTTIISTRCGLDSDCNPSNSAGVLFTTLGYSKIPDRFIGELDTGQKFNYTAYGFSETLEVCEKLARQAVVQEGGRVERAANGDEVFVIPVKPVKLSKLELSWAPGLIANSLFTAAEMDQIVPNAKSRWTRMVKAVSRFAPGWSIAYCGDEMKPGLYSEIKGKKSVLVTHPLNRGAACILSRELNVERGKKTALGLSVTHAPDPDADWVLVVRADGDELLNRVVSSSTANDNGWLNVTLDLSGYAGKRIKLELLNQANGWASEAGYWGEIVVDVE